MLGFKEFISLSEEQLQELMVNRSSRPTHRDYTPVAGGGVASTEVTVKHQTDGVKKFNKVPGFNKQIHDGPQDRLDAEKLRKYKAKGVKHVMKPQPGMG